MQKRVHPCIGIRDALVFLYPGDGIPYRAKRSAIGPLAQRRERFPAQPQGASGRGVTGRAIEHIREPIRAIPRDPPLNRPVIHSYLLPDLANRAAFP